MLDAKMTAPHIKLCIVFGSNVRRKNDGSHIKLLSSSALMLDEKMTAPHIKLCIVFGSNVRRKNDGSTY